MSTTLRILVIVGASLLLSAPAAASEVWGGIRSMGMADAFVGGGGGNSAIYKNPGGVGIAGVFSAEGGYRRSGIDGVNAFGVSIVDASTNPHLAAGVSYSYAFGDGRIDGEGLRGVSDHDIRLVLAVPVVPRKVSFGIGLHYLNYKRGTREELDSAEISSRAFLFDFGAVAAVTPNLSFGAAFVNVGSVDGIAVPRLFRVGSGVFLGPLHVELEYEGDIDTEDSIASSFASGVELLIETVPIRAGFRRDGVRRANYLTTGFGLREMNGGFDAGFKIDPGNSRDWELGVSIIGFF